MQSVAWVFSSPCICTLRTMSAMYILKSGAISLSSQMFDGINIERISVELSSRRLATLLVDVPIFQFLNINFTQPFATTSLLYFPGLPVVFEVQFNTSCDGLKTRPLIIT
ncbi:hypothetical protein B0H17DRAFT_99608 [Mycena rosella]|uniref:Uncharacterized protein n=1 Tax=Mycena rosella TaxID=1033263 RepID=A0AAD7GCU8_MYCRO|nr:hypothetical protein B0H17DRAFT_99608 [Mycena rosella]